MVDSDRALQEYASARNALHKHAGPSGSSADPLGIRRQREARYAQAAKRLVRLGLLPPLKRKYREGAG